MFSSSDRKCLPNICTTGATNGAETPYPSGPLEFTPEFEWSSHLLDLWCSVCGVLQAVVCPFFFFFFGQYVWIPITPLYLQTGLVVYIHYNNIYNVRTPLINTQTIMLLLFSFIIYCLFSGMFGYTLYLLMISANTYNVIIIRYFVSPFYLCSNLCWFITK